MKTKGVLGNPSMCKLIYKVFDKTLTPFVKKTLIDDL